MRRLVLLTMALALIGCQSTTTDRNARPKGCDARALDSGRCVPGEYDSE